MDDPFDMRDEFPAGFTPWSQVLGNWVKLLLSPLLGILSVFKKRKSR